MTDQVVAPPAAGRPARDRARVQQVLDSRDLQVAFQPVIRLRDDQLVGYEALARPGPDWPGPAEFFAAAGRSGLGVAAEVLAVQRAFDQLDQLPPDTWLSVNVSPAVLVSRAARELLSGFRPRQIVVEVTEHDPVQDYPALLTRVAELRARGLQFAVDDAGAGHSSLRHILRLRPEVIKLDIDITRGVHTDPVRQTLARSMVSFARSVGAVLLAEGVEQQAELDMLARIGVDLAQGYLLARPGPLPGPASYPKVDENARYRDLDSVLAQVALAVTAATDAESLVRPLLDVVLEATGMETAYVTFYDAAGQTLEHRYVRNAGSVQLPEGLTLPWPETLCYRLQQKDLVWSADVPRELAGVPMAEQAGVRSFLSLPITGGDGPLYGTLCAGSTEHLFVGEDTLLYLRMLARIVGHYGMHAPAAPPGAGEPPSLARPGPGSGP